MKKTISKSDFIRIYLKLIFLLCFFLLVLVASHIVINKQRVLPDADQLVVYGRDTCGYTTLLRHQLDENNIDYIYANIDKTFVETEMWIKLGYLTGGITSAKLPVVEYQNGLTERPDLNSLLNQITAVQSNIDKPEE